VLAEADTLELARAAAARVEGSTAEGSGAVVTTDGEAAERALAAFASCAVRHGAAPSVTLRVDGKTVVVGPVNEPARAVITGKELKDLGASAAGIEGGTVITSGVIHCRTRVSAELVRCAAARRMSRSVRMPMMFPKSETTSAPTPRSIIFSAASPSESAGSMVRTSRVIRSPTVSIATRIDA